MFHVEHWVEELHFSGAHAGRRHLRLPIEWSARGLLISFCFALARLAEDG